MWRKWLAAAILAGAMAVVAAAQGAFLTNDDVIAMVKAGKDEGTVLTAIQNQGTDFDVSAKAVLLLKKNGVSKKIIDTMLGAVKDQKEAAAAVMSAAQSKAAAEEASQKASAAKAEAAKAQLAAAPSAGAMTGMPSVMLVQNGQKQALAIAHTQIVPAQTQMAHNPNPLQPQSQASLLSGLATDGTLTKSLGSLTQGLAMGGMMKPGSGMPGIASVALMANPMIGPAVMAGSFLLKHKADSQNAAAGAGPGGPSSMTAVWAIPGAKSETVVHGQPSFEVQFDGIAGVNPDEYEPVLIRLTPSQSGRLVGATSTTANQMQSAEANWNMYASFVEQRVPAQATKVASGRYQLQAGSGLSSGEYGVVLRPINKDKKFAGNNVGQNIGDGLVFNCVWSFEVQ